MHKTTTRLPVKQSNKHQRTKSPRSLKTKTIKKQQKQKQTTSRRHFSHSTTPTHLDVALQLQQEASDSHNPKMNPVTRVKFPSPTQWDLTNGLKRPKIGSKNDLYAILAQNTTFYDSQVVIAPRVYNAPKNEPPPIAVEYLTRDVDLPANLNEILNEVGTNEDTKKEHVDTLEWHVTWQRTRAEVPGSFLPETNLGISLTVSTEFHQHFLSVVTKNQQNTRFKPSHLESMAAPFGDTLEAFFIKHSPELSSQLKQNVNNNRMVYSLLYGLGPLCSDSPKFKHRDFVPLLVHAWKTYHLSKNATNNANTHDKSDNSLNNTDNSNNPDNNDPMKQNSYELLWYSLYTISHPSKDMWDRMMMELMPIDPTEEDSTQEGSTEEGSTEEGSTEEGSTEEEVFNAQVAERFNAQVDRLKF